MRSTHPFHRWGAFALGLFSSAAALADTTPQALPFAQNWSNTAQITANDNWSGVPGITGFLGDDAASSTAPYAGGDPQTLTAATLGVNIDAIANQANPNTLTAGGVAEFEIANPTVALQGSGTADSPYLQVYLNTLGFQNINVKYTLRDIDGSADNSVQPVALMYRVGNSGTFTNVPAAYVADASTGPNLATQTTSVNVTLPPAADNQPEVQLRIVTINAAGSDEWTGVDDITVDGVPTGGLLLSVGDARVVEGNTGTVTAQFAVTLSGPAPAGGVTFDISTMDDSATTADSDYQATAVVGGFIPPGSTTVQFNVPVNGDTAIEPTERFFVNLSNVSGTNVFAGDTQGVGTIVADDFQMLSIPQIQGTGRNSPFDGQLAGTNGNVVTAILPNGFFIQQPVSDGVLESSDAMFVFTGTAPAVLVGDVVNVGGLVTEGAMAVGAGEPNYSGLTKFSNQDLLYNVVSSGAAMPTAFVLDAAMPSPNPAALLCAGGTFAANDSVATRNFECLEGMRVSTTTGAISAANQRFATDPVAEMAITTTGARAFREPGVAITAASENVAAAGLTPPAPPLPAGPIWDANPELFEIDLDRLGLPNDQVVPGSVFSATGVLSQEFGGYEIFPDTFTVTSARPPLPTPVPVAAANQLTIGSANVLHLYNDVNDVDDGPLEYDNCAPGSADACPTTQQFQDKLKKVADGIRTVLNGPMVIALEETENLATVSALAAKISADSGGALNYTAMMGSDTNGDPGHINIAFLVRSDVTVNNLTQFNANATWTFNGGSQGLCDATSASGCLHNRPPLLLEATTNVGGAPLNFAVLAVHLRSFIGIDDVSTLANQVAAHRVRQKRLRGAHDVAEIVQNFQTANPSVPLVVVGDYNAYEFSDGYADITGIIRGDYDPVQNEYPIDFDDLNPGTGPNGNITVPPLTEASLALSPTDRYSYVFANNAQLIDHELLSQAAAARFERIAIARANADASLAYETDPNTVKRTSDHDWVVVYLNAGSGPTQNPYGVFKDDFE